MSQNRGRISKRDHRLWPRCQPVGLDQARRGRGDLSGARCLGRQSRERKMLHPALAHAAHFNDRSTNQALGVRWSQHRQARGHAIAPGRGHTGLHPVDLGKRAMGEERIGQTTEIAVGTTDRLGKPDQLAAGTRAGSMQTAMAHLAGRRAHRSMMSAGARGSSGTEACEMHFVYRIELLHELRCQQRRQPGRICGTHNKGHGQSPASCDRPQRGDNFGLSRGAHHRHALAYQPLAQLDLALGRSCDDRYLRLHSIRKRPLRYVHPKQWCGHSLSTNQPDFGIARFAKLSRGPSAHKPASKDRYDHRNNFPLGGWIVRSQIFRWNLAPAAALGCGTVSAEDAKDRCGQHRNDGAQHRSTNHCQHGRTVAVGARKALFKLRKRWDNSGWSPKITAVQLRRTTRGYSSVG